jgi:alpha-N-arabinofuranosidase
LYQQNSLRDALIAASTLNIFNNHCQRVKMANLAQTVNVLQALILTDKEKMLLTPTYYVFDLYQSHQDAEWLPIQFSSPDYSFGNDKIPAINASASRDSSGVVHITVVNLDPGHAIPVSFNITGKNYKSIKGQILSSARFTDINSFDKPDQVIPRPFGDCHLEGNQISMSIPAKSLILLEIK